MLRISGIDEKFNITINKAVDRLSKRKNLTGLILFGSIAKGQSHAYSDIDIYAVGDNEKDRTERFLIDDIPVQVQWRSLQDFREKLIYPKRVLPVLAEGIIIYDPKGYLKQFIPMAKAIYEKGPEPLNVRERTLLRGKLSDGLYEVEGLLICESGICSLFLMDEVLYEALIGYYELNCWWKVSRKKMIKDIKSKEEELYRDIEEYFLENDLNIKMIKLRKIVNKVLSAAGGELKEYILIWKE